MKDQVKQRCHSKTYWLGFAVMVLGFLQQNFSLLDAYLGEYRNAVYLVLGLLIMIFREVTTKPLSEKGKPP